ncbi:unnamed protein product [Brachionus calyciflorus]|uniref:Uncharacterized protein n=1 Tax=Brachionus calyciflorus TaxID=104777 RepID=A0A813TAM6_9BILA|nr:unnamed protein product [Brachionus calyciflorus]
MGRPKGTTKTKPSPKLISYFVKTDEFNTTSTKPISHYVKNDDIITKSTTKRISHYISTQDMDNYSTKAIVSKYLSCQNLSSSKENKSNSIQSEVENKNRNETSRPSKRKYISQLLQTDLNVKNNIIVENTENKINTEQILLNENLKENESVHSNLDKRRKGLISDIIKNKEENKLEVNYQIQPVPPLPPPPQPEPRIILIEAPKPVVVPMTKRYKPILPKRRSKESAYISDYFKDSVETLEKKETEPQIIYSEPRILKGSKLISQYIKEKNQVDSENIFDLSKRININPEIHRIKRTPKKSAIQANYISSFIREKEGDNGNLTIRESTETLNQILRRTNTLNYSPLRNSPRKHMVRRLKMQRDKFLKKFIKLDNIVANLRKKKKLD